LFTVMAAVLSMPQRSLRVIEGSSNATLHE
jgi:hypothetical protein